MLWTSGQAKAQTYYGRKPRVPPPFCRLCFPVKRCWSVSRRQLSPSYLPLPRCSRRLAAASPLSLPRRLAAASPSQRERERGFLFFFNPSTLHIGNTFLPLIFNLLWVINCSSFVQVFLNLFGQCVFDWTQNLILFCSLETLRKLKCLTDAIFLF